MTFRVLIVDDETPALRFMQVIINKYVPEFTVCEMVTSSAQALAYLSQNPVDLLITDISMPGMDGIALAKEVRKAHPDIRIMIVSGYAEFDYARGALSVSADDYLLKPLSVPHVTESLKKIHEKLSQEYILRRNDAICALACAMTPNLPDEMLSQPHCFALIRLMNLPAGQHFRLYNTSVIPSPDFSFTVLRGVDENERILVSDQPFDAFRADCLSFLGRADAACYTAVLNRTPIPLISLRGFVKRAVERIERRLIVGKKQIIYLEDRDPPLPAMENPSAILHKIEHFTTIGNTKMIKETFFNMAAQWDAQQYTQQQICTVIYPLVQQILIGTPSLTGQQDRILRETAEIIQYATSCTALVAGLYDVLFNDANFHDKRLSPKELCDTTMAYIRENHAQPLSIQNICTEIGVSQTYLSRLMRKYGETSFSAYLTNCRMEAAMDLIRQHPDILLRDVAACVGYDDASYFSKVFHQTTGKTPTQFAAMILSER